MSEYRVLKASLDGVVRAVYDGLWEELPDQPDLMTPDHALQWTLNAMSDAGWEVKQIFQNDRGKGDIEYKIVFGRGVD